MSGEQDDTVLDRLDARQLAAVAAVPEHAEVAQRGADAPIIAPVGEGLQQLTELVEIRTHLQAGDAGLLVDDAEKSARLERELKQVANVFTLRRRVKLVNVLHAPLRGRQVHRIEILDGRIGDEHDQRDVVLMGRAHERDPAGGGDAPAGEREAAQHRLRIVGILDGGEQRQRVLDLAFLEETATTGHLVGHAALTQRAHRRLHVDVLAEEPRDVRGPHSRRR